MSAMLSDLSGFEEDAVSWKASLSRYLRDTFYGRAEAILSQNTKAKKGANPKAQFIRNVTSFIVHWKGDAIRSVGFNPDTPETLEALALAFLHYGNPKHAVMLAIRRLRSNYNDTFLLGFFGNVRSSVTESLKPPQDPQIIEACSEAVKIFLEELLTFEPEGELPYVRGRLAELLDEESLAEWEYRLGVELGKNSCYIPLFNLLLKRGEKKEALKLMEDVWHRTHAPEFAKTLSNFHNTEGNIAKSMQYFSILKGLSSSELSLNIVPNPETLSFPSGLSVCREYLLYQVESKRPPVLERRVVAKVRNWLSAEFAKLAASMGSDESFHTDENFEDRLAILQFGAIELADAEFANRYLNEILLHLSPDGLWKDFLKAYLEEHASPYAEAFSLSLEEESLQEFAPGIFMADWGDGDPLKSDIGEKEFSDLWDAFSGHLSYFSYLFQYVGDEELFDLVREVIGSLKNSDDHSGKYTLASSVEGNSLDLEQTLRRFSRFSKDFRQWYFSLQRSVLDKYGSSFLRNLMVSARYSPNSTFDGDVRSGILYFSETLLSQSEFSNESFHRFLDAILDGSPPNAELEPLAELLFYSDAPGVVTDVVLSGYFFDPKLFRWALKLGLNEPECVPEIERDLREALEENEWPVESVIEFAKRVVLSLPEDSEAKALAQGNLAMAMQAFSPEGSEVPTGEILATYDHAIALWDTESLVRSAEFLILSEEDLEEGERRLFQAFRSGDASVLGGVCALYERVGDLENFRLALDMAESLRVADTEIIRIQYLLSQGREERLSALKHFFALSDFPRTQLPEDIVEFCLATALTEIAPESDSEREYRRLGKFDHLLTALRFTALVSNDEASARERAIQYWETLLAVLADPETRDDVVDFLRFRNHPDIETDASENLSLIMEDPSHDIVAVLTEALTFQRHFSHSADERYLALVDTIARAISAIPGGAVVAAGFFYQADAFRSSSVLSKMNGTEDLTDIVRH